MCAGRRVIGNDAAIGPRRHLRRHRAISPRPAQKSTLYLGPEFLGSGRRRVRSSVDALEVSAEGAAV